jgi:hypothetical protein
VQDPFAAKLAQLWLKPYTLLFLTMPDIDSVAPPVLVSVTVFGGLVVPTGWLVNVSEVGLSETAGAAAALTVMLCVTAVAAL